MLLAGLLITTLPALEAGEEGPALWPLAPRGADDEVEDTGKSLALGPEGSLSDRPWLWAGVGSLVALAALLGIRGWTLQRRLRAQTRDLEQTVRQRTVACRDGERKYRSLFEHSRDAIVLTDEGGRITELNTAASDLLGYPARALSGTRLSELMIAGRSTEQLLEELERHGEVHGISGSMLGRSGALDVLLSAQPRLHEDGSPAGHQVILRDLARLQEVEAEFQRSQKMDAVGRLAGGIAHDFNNLLTVILGNVELLQESPALRPSDADAVEAVEAAALRARALASQLRTFSRGQPLSMRPVELSDLARRCRPLLEELLGDGGQLRLRCSSPAWLRADEGQLEQVLLNLAVNARDAMQGQGTLHVELESHPTVPVARLRVWDTGPGIEAELLPHVFEPFVTTKESRSGTGLGLATVYGIVRQLGGEVQASNLDDAGACFEIGLPTCEPPIEPEPETPRPEAVPQTSRRVVVVEDDAPIRRLLEKILSKAGHVVTVFPDAITAREWVRREDPDFDVLLTDVVMPRMLGTTLAGELRSLRPELPVVYVSGQADTERLRSELSEPSTAFVAKPFASAQVLAALDRVSAAQPEPEPEPVLA